MCGRTETTANFALSRDQLGSSLERHMINISKESGLVCKFLFGLLLGGFHATVSYTLVLAEKAPYNPSAAIFRVPQALRTKTTQQKRSKFRAQSLQRVLEAVLVQNTIQCTQTGWGAGHGNNTNLRVTVPPANTIKHHTSRSREATRRSPGLLPPCTSLPK